MALIAGNLSDYLTFTRATTAYFVNSSGYLEVSPINTPRFNYDPITLQPRGLMIEQFSANYLTRSTDFTHADWTTANASVTADAATSPENLVEADKLVSTNAAPVYVTQTCTIVDNTSENILSCFFKADTVTNCSLWMQYTGGVAQGFIAEFDLTAGTIVSEGTSTTARIVNYGNGWYRCFIAGTNNGTGNTSLNARMHVGNGSMSISDSVYIWGAMVERTGLFSSFIKTTANPASRNSEIITYALTGINASEGSLFAEVSFNSELPATYLQTAVALGNGSTSSSYIGLCRVGTGDVAQGRAVHVSLSNALVDGQDPGDNVSTKLACAFAQDDFAFVQDGVVEGTSGTCNIPADISVMTVGSVGAGVSFLNGHIKQLQYYPTRLSNSQLQNLTA